jgi:hypothetical protein
VASATSHISEAALIKGYQQVAFREEPCACGGVIVSNERTVSDAVDAHNASTGHQQWRNAHPYSRR